MLSFSSSFYEFIMLLFSVQLSSVQSLSYIQHCHPMNCSTPGLPVYHQVPEFTQTHIHRVSDAIQRVSDAIQPSHPLSSSSPPTPNPSQHQGLFIKMHKRVAIRYPGKLSKCDRTAEGLNFLPHILYTV